MIVNIFKMVGLSIFLFIYFITLICVIWFCVNVNFDVDKISLSIAVFLCCFPLLLVYISIIIKNRQIAAVLVRIQEILAKSIFVQFAIKKKYLALLAIEMEISNGFS